MLPRSNTIEYGRRNGKETVTKIVRAASKPGAILTARLDAVSQIPLREQEVGIVDSIENDRFLNKWKVEIRDKGELEDLGI